MKQEKILRYCLFGVGMIFTALGIALITQAGKGTSAVASPAYVLSCLLPWSMGSCTIAVNLVMMTIQAILLKRSFFPKQLLQLPASIAFGGLIDLFRTFLGRGGTGISWLYLCFGCFALGFGVGLQKLGDVLMLPSEGAVRSIAKKGAWEFSRVKVWFDVSLVTISAVVSMLFVGSVVGIREGTLIAAIVTGPISRLAYTQLGFLLRKRETN